MERLAGLLGIIVLLGLAYAFSTDRKAIKLRTVAWGLGLQILFAIVVLRVPLGRAAIESVGDGVRTLLGYSFAGSKFVFGVLGDAARPTGFYFAFMVLPTIIFMSAFFAMMYHFGVMQFIVKMMARIMQYTMRVTGVESLVAAANVFMGQTEAPLTIRPFLPHVTRSELMTVMTTGFASVSGGIMAAYIQYGIDPKHLLSAVIMTAPGAILFAKILEPEREQPLEAAEKAEVPEAEELKHANVLGAIANGTTDGLRLALNVAAMLIAFLALIALVNGIFGGVSGLLGRVGIPFPSSLEVILGYVFLPIAWLIGVPGQDAFAIAQLLGTRMVTNELVAFPRLYEMRAALDPRSFTIATYALTGFANLGSIGIQIGGISALAPNKRDDLTRLGFKAMLAGTMANLMSAAIVGVIML
jgi:CNT family concentrative nucleoside transporter